MLSLKRDHQDAREQDTAVKKQNNDSSATICAVVRCYASRYDAERREEEGGYNSRYHCHSPHRRVALLIEGDTSHSSEKP